MNRATGCSRGKSWQAADEGGEELNNMARHCFSCLKKVGALNVRGINAHFVPGVV
jgi:hypothetical protein